MANGSLHVMHVSPTGIAFMHRWESCKLYAYLDIGGVWTIGWGTTVYPNGKRVKEWDTCTQAEADAWFTSDLVRFERDVDSYITDQIFQPEFDALTSLCYNIGPQRFKTSTLRRRVNVDHNDPDIRRQFMAWHYDDVNGDGHLDPVQGLWNRRHDEADMYFRVATTCPLMP